MPHVSILGKHHCAALRKQAFEQRAKEFSDIFSRRDYSERFVLKPGIEIQSQHFGGNRTLSIEGVSVEFYQQGHDQSYPQGKKGDDDDISNEGFVSEFFSHLSDDSRQDAATTNAHMMQLIISLHSRGILDKVMTWLWESTDGCAKQYRCATAIYLLSTLCARFDIVIDRSIDAPGHGKNIIDAMNGIDKKYLEQTSLRVINPQKVLDLTHQMSQAKAPPKEAKLMTKPKAKPKRRKKTKKKSSLTDDEKINISHSIPKRFVELHDSTTEGEASFAKAAKQLLEDPTRCNGVHDTKSAKRQANSTFKARHYFVQNKDDVKHSLVNMSWKNTLFPKLPAPESQPNVHGKHGVMTHYHFRVDPKLGEGKCAIRRIPCACAACIEQMQKHWDPKIKDPSEQPRYSPVQQCTYSSILGAYNDWVIMDFKNKATPEEEFDELHAIVLDGMAESKAQLVEIDGYGALSTDDDRTEGYYIVRFVSCAYTLQEDTQTEAGDILKQGELVCDAVYAALIGKKGKVVPTSLSNLWCVEPEE